MTTTPSTTGARPGRRDAALPARPRLRRLAATVGVVLAVVAIGVVALVMPAGAAWATADSVSPAGSLPAPKLAHPPAGTGQLGEVAGTSVTQVPTAGLAQELERIRADGLNTVSEMVWWLVDSPRSATLHPFGGTVSDAVLDQRIATERAAGMDVVLIPVFYCTGCEGGWRGTMHPRSTAAFMANYRRFIDRYASLAQRDGAWMLFVGSEMTSLESQTGSWLSVVSDARHLFGGLLAYEENWDVIGHADFARTVDVIGVSAYFPLDDAAVPSLSDLAGDWHHSQASATPGRDWTTALARLASTTHRPIMFGEAGYMASDYAGRQPFLEFQGKRNWRLQADLYQALLETFEGKPWWLGAVWWEWYPSRDLLSDDRTPRGRTAEGLLQTWYAGAQRPADPATELFKPLPDELNLSSDGSVAGPALSVAPPLRFRGLASVGVASWAAVAVGGLIFAIRRYGRGSTPLGDSA